MSTFNATLAGNVTMSGGAGAANILLNEELERSKKENQDQAAMLELYKEELMRLEKRYVYAEHEAAEALTALAVASRAAHEDSVHNNSVIQHLQQQVDDLMATQAPSQAYAAVMLQVEKTIPCILIEVMNHIGQRGMNEGGEDNAYSMGEVACAVPPAVLEAVRSLHPVAALTQLKLWVRKLVELDRESLAQLKVNSRKNYANDRAGGKSLRRAGSMWKLDRSEGQEDTSALLSIPSSLRATVRKSPQQRRSVVEASFDDEAVELVRKRNLELEREVETMRGFVRAAEEDLERVRQAAQLAVYSAQRDMGDLRLEVRRQTREIELLKGRSHLVDRSQLIAAQDELEALKKKLAETHKNAATALQAKSTEFAFVQREKADQIRELEIRLNRASKAHNQQRELAEALAAAKQETATVKQQLARTNAKELVEQKAKIQSQLQKQAETSEDLRRSLDHAQTSLKALKQTNQKMIQQYNEIFEARLTETRERAKQGRDKERAAATLAVCGPNSEVNAQYYRVRYQEAMTDLKKAQKKLKHLIFLSHHDHLSFHLQREDLSLQLRDVKSMLTSASHLEEGDSNDDDEDDKRILSSIATGRRASPDGGSRHYSGSPDSGEDATARILNNDFSFASYVAAQQQRKHADNRRSPSRSVTPARSRPGTAESRHGYDVITSSKAVHTHIMTVVGVTATDLEQSAVFTNPLESTVMARVSSSVRPREGKFLELSRRTTARQEESANSSSTFEDTHTMSMGDDGTVTEGGVELLPIESESLLPQRFNPRSHRSVAYLRKSRMTNPVASLSKPMTPVLRPASAML